MRLYHFVNRLHALEDIRHRRLKVATIDDLNDPFELRGVSLADRDERRAFELFREEFAKLWGMLCFSKIWRNPVQWSHYADRHSGLCLGFDIPDDLVSIVTYQAHLHQQDIVDLLKGGDLIAAEAAMENLLSTKYSHWKYEREARLFIDLKKTEPDSGLHFISFGPKLALREIIVGHRSTINRRELANALSELSPYVSTTKARLAFKSFSVVRQRNQRLWT